jgi:hypothetical protein
MTPPSTLSIPLSEIGNYPLELMIPLSVISIRLSEIGIYETLHNSAFPFCSHDSSFLSIRLSEIGIYPSELSLCLL